MVFSSHLFVYYFLPVALLLYYLLPRRWKLGGLAALSYLFYGWANPAFCLLMLFSTVVDYVCGRVLGASRSRRLVAGEALPPARAERLAVVVSVVTNLALLGFFKYFNLAAETWDALVAGVGLGQWGLDTALRVTLPLGISFYTFQSMSYTIDVYRGRAEPLTDFVAFAAYVSMFPQLVAGPIIRFSEVADQLRSRTHTLEKLSRGVVFVCLGMAKKVLLANPCGRVADAVFDAGSVGALDAWYGVAAYSFQIYFDFSGYSDMAIGLGLMMGFVFPKNFDSPYKSVSVTDFWRRWHISLSTWLRDYLYVPLGGNRLGARRTYVNLGVVMVLGGLWHGAAWTFVLWGAFHGAWLAAERLLGKRSLVPRLPRPFLVASTYLGLLVSWVLFRAGSLEEIGGFLAAMAGLGQPQAGASLLAGWIWRPYYLGTFLAAGIVTWGAPQTWDWSRRLGPGKVALSLLAFWAALVAMASQGYNPFIYFIF
jgi:alginate O-acetyltransferase complex protein AlgI